ncbi:sugar ABC transporter ATP-binding protein [Nitratireductor kimnyeongensis]|uniref:Sugar ABC transporter ATP-binding protein n=1 Tax=Nitratireductor kimnyeongensis TaxID=430679 RepID=A0ABW0T808_9HYPH
MHLELRAGEVHSLVGENGAGKSTLMKIVSGVYSLDHGDLIVEGKPVRFNNVLDAINMGISLVHQELVNCPDVSIAENIFMNKIARGRMEFVNFTELNRRARDEMTKFHLDLDPRMKMSRLSVSQQQIVEIVKAISINAKVIIFDEPTSSLTETETEDLFKIIAALKKRGVGILYISHRMEEIFTICDRVTILRDGHYIDTLNVNEVDKMSIINKMIGREVADFFPPKASSTGDTILSARGFEHATHFHGIDFDLKRGEILGFSGLIGCGRSELFKCLCGLDAKQDGELSMNGEVLDISRYSDALKHGIVYLTEDRKNEGLFLEKSIQQNTSALNLDNIVSGFFLSVAKEERLAAEFRSSLSIKSSNVQQLCVNLSGGNQQKVLIAKGLAISPRIIIFDEPTKGIDIGAKIEIYRMMRDLAENGIGVIIVSSDLMEAVGLCDRVVIMHEGRIAAIASDDQITETFLHHQASGVFAHGEVAVADA